MLQYNINPQSISPELEYHCSSLTKITLPWTTKLLLNGAVIDDNVVFV